MISIHVVAAVMTLLVAASAPRSQQAASLPALSQSPDPVLKYSKARAARLSEVKGDVALDRNAGKGFEIAFANEPISEQTSLETGVGRAEVEFEDNSSVRLAPYSVVEFPRLELLPSGATASTVRVLKGTAYVSLMPSYVVNNRGNEFELAFASRTLHLYPSSHIRVQIDGKQARLVIFEGSAKLDGPEGATTLARKKTYILDLENQSGVAVDRAVRSIPTDKWDNGAAEFHIRNAGLKRSSDPFGKGRTSSSMRHDIFR